MTRTKSCLIFFFVLAICTRSLSGQPTGKKIFVEWKSGMPSGTIQVQHGNIQKVEIVKGKGKVKGSSFTFSAGGNNRISILVEGVKDQPGPNATIISVQTAAHPFSFFTRDVHLEYPIYLPQYGVIVLSESDPRSFAEVEQAVLNQKLRTKIQRIETEPEVSFSAVADKVKKMSVPTWLGVSRDFRLFEISESLTDAAKGEANMIAPKRSSSSLKLPQMKNEAANYLYSMGRGVGVQENVKRRLEQGVMPILHSELTDDDIVYHSTMFAALEKSAITALKGTDFLVADSFSGGHMFTKEQGEALKTRTPAALDTDEETVLFFKSEIRNTGSVPRYAWIKTARPGTGWWHKFPYTFDAKTGFSVFPDGKVFCISKLNGKPLANEEMAILLKPGETAVFEFFLPHSPLPAERAHKLAGVSYADRLNESKSFWAGKLKNAAKISVPEKRIDEMIQAGLLHLDLITYGNEPNGTLAPSIGVYSPIGTESAPIIQFYASMGLYDVAKRSLNYFLDKQHEDGFIQNFGGYMVETGAALWSMGEYFRYTKDLSWANEVQTKLIKSCDYLFAWRNKNKRPELKGRGYGMIDGKVADPEDHFHQFMLNGYAYLGLVRVAEILDHTNPAEAARVRNEAQAWKQDIRESFFNTMALSPVVPLGDGTWSPTAPPWTETVGLRALYLKEESFWSHGTFGVSDAMLGPMYLVFCEVLDVTEPAAKTLLDYNSELFYQGNAAFSQPYYSRHNWMQAKLGMTKPFLSTYYNTFAAHADRETYTFWEHLFRVSAHKTHEEAWFLMETRWMLYMEDGTALKLFGTIPRTWMEDGKEIVLENVQSYFGPINARIQSHLGLGFIEATVSCTTDRKPEKLLIRVPHPQNKLPVKVTGGSFDPKTELVTVDAFKGEAQVRLEY